MKKFILIVLVLVGAGMALAHFRLQITRFAIVRILESQGMAAVEFVPAGLDGRGLLISKFSGILPDSSIRIRLQRAEIHWNTAQIKKKQLAGLQVGKLRIEHIGNKTGLQHHINIPDVIRRTANQLAQFPQIPFKKLQIETLMVSGFNGPFTGVPLSLFLAVNEKKKSIEGRLLVKEQHVSFTVHGRPAVGYDFMLKKNSYIRPLLSGNLRGTSSALSLRINGNLSTLFPVLSQPGKSLPTVTGHFTARVNLALRTSPAIHSTLQLENLACRQISAERITLVLNGAFGSAGSFTLDDDSVLSIDTLKSSTGKIGRIDIPLAGRINKSGTGWFYAGSTEPAKKTTAITVNRPVVLQAVSTPDFSIDKLNLARPEKIQLQDDKILISIGPTNNIVAEKLRLNKINLSRVTLATTRPTTIQVKHNPQNGWTVAPTSWQVTAGSIQLPNMKLELQPLTVNLKQLTGNSSKWRLGTEITCPAIHLNTDKNGIVLRNISTEFQGDSANIHGQGSWSLSAIPGVFILKLRHNLETGNGMADISTPAPLTFSKNNPLSAMTDTWSLPGDLTGGELKGKSAIHWQPLKMTARISLTNGTGHFRDINFSGLSTSQNILIYPFIKSIKPGSLTIDTTYVGIPIHNFSTNIRLKPTGKPLPEIILNNTRASILGGTVSNDYIQIEPGKTDLQTTIRLNNIQLADLLTIQPVKGLRVTGSVHGELPIRLDKAGLHVDTGKLTNEKTGGIIEYNPPGENGLKNSPLTGYALKALEEFHYNLLSASADYSPDGTLAVKLHLEGKSPKLDTKRPVHLNITTEQNLLSLLQSLRYSASLTNEIDREVQQHFHKKSSP